METQLPNSTAQPSSSIAELDELESLGSQHQQSREVEAKVETRFFPPVYRQRYAAVGMLVQKYQAKKVIDFGCAEGKFMRHLINVDSSSHMEVLIGVDIDHDLLEQNKFRIQPLTSDYLRPRCQPFKVCFYQGSITEADERFIDFDLVAGIEVIEHLKADTLDAMPRTLFGQLKPKVVVLTTPNAEFNVLFPNLQGFRHYDHKFEWTREQFQEWSHSQASRYGYTAVFDGIGAGPEGTEHLGCCSQMAVFERVSPTADCANTSGIHQPYNLIVEVEFPFRRDNTTKEEKILKEVEYILWVLSAAEKRGDENITEESTSEKSDDNNDSCAEYEDSCETESDEVQLYSFERLYSFHSLHKLCENLETLRSVLEASSIFSLSDDKSGVLWCRPSAWSSDENDTDWDENCSPDEETFRGTIEQSAENSESNWDENSSATEKDANVCWNSSDNKMKFWDGEDWDQLEDKAPWSDEKQEHSTTLDGECNVYPLSQDSDSSLDNDDDNNLVWIETDSGVTEDKITDTSLSLT